MSHVATSNFPSSSVSEAEVSKLRLKAGRSREFDVCVPAASLSIRQIQQHIPPRYFERSARRSFFYLARDIAQVVATYYIMYNVCLPAVSAIRTFCELYGSAHDSHRVGVVFPSLVTALLWGVFWFVQGLNGTALWVLAHECGHQAFSASKTLNDFLGLCLHSTLLVPYHSWRITHGAHHKHTNHLTKDLVFVPPKRDRVGELIEETPLVMLFDMMVMFVFGWPAHLLGNASGQNFGRLASHFDPSAPFFRREDYYDVVISDLGIFTVLGLLAASFVRFGWGNVLCWYVVPYLWVNFWLVYITFMQHTDIRLPHYTQEHWTFVRGAVAAVDRDYGALLNTWLHHINDSHVVHHLFSQIPHYNAIAVTRNYIKEILGETYITDKRPLWQALLNSWKECRYVVPSEGVCVFYK